MPTRTTSSVNLQVSGTFLGFNLSEEGAVEGALVATPRGEEQINFPRYLARSISRAVGVGSAVDFDVELESGASAHRIYRLRKVEGEARGVVVRLNYEARGNVSGYHLDDATFLYVGPEGAKRYEVRVGETVRATGERCPGVDAIVLAVHTLERVTRIGKRHDDGAAG